MIIFDGENELSFKEESFTKDLSPSKTVELYQSTLIYYKLAKTFNTREGRLAQLKDGLSTLLKKMTSDVGEDLALLIAAKADLEVQLCD